MNLIRGRIDFEVEVPDGRGLVTQTSKAIDHAVDTFEIAMNLIGCRPVVRTGMVGRRKARDKDANLPTHKDVLGAGASGADAGGPYLDGILHGVRAGTADDFDIPPGFRDIGR